MITIKINIFFFAQRRPPLLPSPPSIDGRECLPKERRTKKIFIYISLEVLSQSEEYLEAILLIFSLRFYFLSPVLEECRVVC